MGTLGNENGTRVGDAVGVWKQVEMILSLGVRRSLCLHGGVHFVCEIGFLTGKQVVIAQRGAHGPNRQAVRQYDQHPCKARHLTENFFAKLKPFRGIATRDDKTAGHFLGCIYWCAALIWLDG